MMNDARFLFRHGRWHSAVYLACYAVECQLKAAVCQHLGVEELPKEFHTHNLRWLAESAGLVKALKNNPTIHGAFRQISGMWDAEIRYARKPYDKRAATTFLNDVRRFVRWLSETLLQRR